MAKDLQEVRKIVFICNGTCCTDGGAEANTTELRDQLKREELWDTMHTVRTRCMGQCKEGPIVFVHPEGVWYKEVDTTVARQIVTEHLQHDRCITTHLLHPEQQPIIVTSH